MKSKKPRRGVPDVLTLAELCRVLGLTPQRVNQLEREGVIKKLERGLYPVAAITDYVGHLRQTIQGSGSGLGLTAERAELVKEQTLKARLERQRLEGELVPASQVAMVWEAIVRAVQSHMLAIPSKTAARVGMCQNAVEVQALLRREIEEALSELSKVDFKAAPFHNEEADAAE